MSYNYATTDLHRTRTFSDHKNRSELWPQTMKWNEDELYVLKHGKNELELSWHNGDANF